MNQDHQENPVRPHLHSELAPAEASTSPVVDNADVVDDSQDVQGGGASGSDTGPGVAEGIPEPPSEAAEPKRQRTGITENPTEEQIESHNCTGHAVFEPWCIDCCRGRSQEWAHYRADRSQDEVPTILWDYAYLSSPSPGRCTEEEEKQEEDRGSSPMLVGWDSSIKRFYCHILPAKGTDFPGLEALS